MAGTVSSPFGDPEDMAILNDETPEEKEEQSQEEEEKEILDELESDSDDDDEDEDKGDDEGEEDDKEDDDDKEEKEDEPDDKEKLGTKPNSPTYGAIRRKYPEFFKDFPALRDVIFQEQQFRESFATVEDARDAAELLNNYRAVEQNITSGDPDQFLEVLEEYDKNTAVNFIDRFLPTLAKTRADLFQRATQPYLKHVLRTVYKEVADADSGDRLNMKNAVLHIHKKLFGDFEVDKSVKLEKPPEPQKDEKYEQEKQRFWQEKENSFRTSVSNDARTKLSGILEKSIDPNKALSDYDRRNIQRDVLDEIDKALAADTQHMALMGSLWARAKKSGWQPEFMERITTAYLSRVKLIAPSIVQKARSEALKARRSNGRPASKTRTAPNPSGRPKSDGGRLKEDEIDWRRSSDLDILNDTPKRRN